MPRQCIHGALWISSSITRFRSTSQGLPNPYTRTNKNSLKETGRDSNSLNGDSQHSRTSPLSLQGSELCIRSIWSIWPKLCLIPMACFIQTQLLGLTRIQRWSMVWVLSDGVLGVLRRRLLCSVNALRWSCLKSSVSSWQTSCLNSPRRLTLSCCAPRCWERKALSINLSNSTAQV